jgi:hypothetical protein
MRQIWIFFVVLAVTATFTGGQEVSPPAKKAVETIGEVRRIGAPDEYERTNPTLEVPGLLRTLN